MDDRLAPFIGEWTVAASLGDDLGKATLEWIIDGCFVVQRMEIAHPDAPDTFAILGPDDSRGVARRYENCPRASSASATST